MAAILQSYGVGDFIYYRKYYKNVSIFSTCLLIDILYVEYYDVTATCFLGLAIFDFICECQKKNSIKSCG